MVIITSLSCLGRLTRGARLLDDLDELASEFFDFGHFAAGHGVGIDERAADAERERAGFQKRGGGVEVHAAGGHEADLGQRAGQRFEIRRAGQIGGKIFTMSAPASQAARTSVGSEHPGITNLS